MSMGALENLLKAGAKTTGLVSLLAFALFGANAPAHATGIIDGNALESIGDEFDPIPGMPPNAQFCQIILTQDGMMVPNVDRTHIGSQIAGGRPGFANVTATNARYSLSVAVPASFSSAPAGAADDTTFSANFLGTGATNFGFINHTVQQRIKRGTTRVRTEINVVKNSGTFPGGNYSAQLTLRCE